MTDLLITTDSNNALVPTYTWRNDSRGKQCRDQAYGLINYLCAGDGKPFFTTGKWKESISDIFLFLYVINKEL